MKTIQEKAYAKLNISLDVGKCREDGFHEMTMVMQSISLADAVTVTLNDSGKVRARTSLSFIPGDERRVDALQGRVNAERHRTDHRLPRRDQRRHRLPGVGSTHAFSPAR